MSKSSRLSGYYQLSVAQRVAVLAEWADLSPQEIGALADGLSVAQADKMVENVVGRYSLPLGIGANFVINGEDFLVPLVVEEPSVVAAVSYAAKLARSGGGFHTGSTDSVMIAQIQLLDVPDPVAAEQAILAEKEALLRLADTSPTIARLGGGPRDIQVRPLPDTPTGPMLIVHLLFDTQDAMGANAINTAAEAIAPSLERLSGGTALLRILSNLTDQRRAWAEVTIPAASFSTIDHSGDEVIRNIAHANAFAVADPYRAATHNKGILNGIDAVALATGNDWRAIEAGAHAYAARDGQYRALTDWHVVADAGNGRRGFGVIWTVGTAFGRGNCGRGDQGASGGPGGVEDFGRHLRPAVERDYGRSGAGPKFGRPAGLGHGRHSARPHEPARPPGGRGRRGHGHGGGPDCRQDGARGADSGGTGSGITDKLLMVDG